MNVLSCVYNELQYLSRRFNTTLKSSTEVNRPFYRYGGRIELIRFKEYYRMSRGHEYGGPEGSHMQIKNVAAN